MNLKKVSDGLHKLNTSQIIALGFAGVIFVGGLILWMPFCSAPGQAVTFPDAVFTAATSVCVTGLSTVVMAVQWSPIGKAVILCLIQIGGIGRTGEYDIHQPPAENFPEKPADHQGILQPG